MGNTVIRFKIGDYLNTGTDIAPVWSLMGTGFNALDESPQAQVDTKAYISDRAATTIIKGYQVQFSFDLIEDDPACIAIYNIGRNQLTSGQAELGSSKNP